MPQPAAFTRSFAHLVWLLVHRPNRVDEQKGALRLALAETRGGESTLSLTELSLSVAEVAQLLSPAAAELSWLTELTARMAGHSVSLVVFSAECGAADMLGIARALAAHPVHGDEGAGFDARIVALNGASVRVRLGRAGFVRTGTPASAMRGIGAASARTPPLGIAILEPQLDQGPPASQGLGTPISLEALDDAARAARLLRASNDDGPTIDVASIDAPRLPRVEALFGRLDVADSSAESDLRLMDELSRLVEASARDGAWPMVAETMARILAYEATITNVDLKRAYVIHVRRLFKPGILRGIAQLLPKHRESRESVQQILTRAGELGADVLIELLVRSEQSAERRAYRTAIACCPAAGSPLMHLLLDGRWYVVRNAAELLGEMRVVEADTQLAVALRHSDARVRRSAASALARLATARSVYALQHALGDSSTAVRLQVVLGLSSAGSASSVSALLSALEAEEEQEVQLAILAALGRHPTVESVDRLAIAARPGTLLHRRPTAFRMAAAEALSGAGTHAALAVLRGLLNDKDAGVRFTAERLLTGRAHDAPARRLSATPRR